MTRTRPWFPLLLALALGCSGVGRGGAEEDEERPGGRRDRPEQIFLDARVELYEGAQLRGAIQARRMEQQRKRSLIRMRDSVEVVSWDSLGRVETLTLCDSLLYRRDRRDLTAEGHVRVLAASDPKGKRLSDAPSGGAGVDALRRKPPLRLLTTRLDWVQRIQRIQTEEPITFYTSVDTLRGVGFGSDRKLRNWEIRRPQGVTHRAPEEGKGRRRSS